MKKQKRRFRRWAPVPLGIVVGFLIALIGVALILGVNAAGYFVGLEAETGVVSGNATKVQSASASAGTVVKFGTTASLLTEDFSSYPTGTCYNDGQTFGPWTSAFASYGCTSVVTFEGNKVLQESPQPSTRLDETHSSLVLSPATSGPIMVKAKMRTVKQLRTPSPHPWEVAWIFWNYTREGSFYYFAPKTNGWELGKSDNTRINPNGPECLFPTYQNCKYPGAQRFLADADSPKFPIGQWYTVVVTQTANNTMTVTVNGQHIVSFTDTESPFTSGKAGLYNEDSTVMFDDVVVSRP